MISVRASKYLQLLQNNKKSKKSKSNLGGTYQNTLSKNPPLPHRGITSKQKQSPGTHFYNISQPRMVSLGLLSVE